MKERFHFSERYRTKNDSKNKYLADIHGFALRMGMVEI
jgi:hypothetical protein